MVGVGQVGPLIPGTGASSKMLVRGLISFGALTVLSLCNILHCRQGRPAHSLREDEIERLIASLPQAGEELQWDPIADRLVEDSAALQLRQWLLAGRELSNGQWQSALARTKAIRLPARWPASSPLAVAIIMPSWLNNGLIRLEPELPALRPALGGCLLSNGFYICGTEYERILDKQLYQELGVLPKGSYAIPCRIFVERNGENGDPVILSISTINWRLQIVDGVDDAIPPIVSPTINGGVQAAITVVGREWQLDGQRKSKCFLVVDPNTELLPALETTALSLQVSVLHEEQIAETVLVVASPWETLRTQSWVFKAPHRCYTEVGLKSISVEMLENDKDLEGWSLRIQGTGRQVLELFDADTRWAGDIRVSLQEAARRGRERSWAPR